MTYRVGVLIFAVCITVSMVSGCATITNKQKDAEIQGLRDQVSVLETQLKAKDDEIESVKNNQFSSSAVSSSIPEVKSHPTARQIQAALKNAGYNPGSTNGHIGKQTRDAIKSFQRANGLAADGKVGSKTWKILAPYLYQKSK